MGLSSSQLQPQELVTFKKLPTNVTLESIEIPERAENRHPTNVKWLIILGIFIAILLPFMIYTLCYADISRLIVGYDKCGNTCGKKNYQWENVACSGKDFRDSPYLEYEDSYYGGERGEDFVFKDRRCVQSCKNGYSALLGRCFKQSKQYQLDAYPGHDVSSSHAYDGSDLDLGVYFSSVKWQLIISCLLAILISIGMLFLFRFAVAFVVWGILLGCFTGLLLVVLTFWYFYATTSETKESRNSPKDVLLFGGIVLTILAVCLGIVLLWCRKKVRLVILLLKETTKAVFDMPGLIVIPLACVCALIFLTAIFALTTAFMATSGRLEKITGDFYSYVSDPVMIFTMIYNLVVFLWLSQFFTGIQYMIIAGAVAKWYFTRDKNGFLGSPILNSMSIAFKFHLGTVALGSLLITLIQLIKMVISSLFKNDKLRLIVNWCIESIENLFKFLSKNAYIVTAMHGQAFLRSGKRATKLLVQNLGDVVAVNFIGDFVLGMAKLLIVIVTLLLSVGIFAIAPGVSHQAMHYPAYIVVGIFAALVATVAFGVFETTIDTIFICYCEDNLLNDGMAKPYLMSRNLMEFVQESKVIYEKK